MICMNEWNGQVKMEMLALIFVFIILRNVIYTFTNTKSNFFSKVQIFPFLFFCSSFVWRSFQLVPHLNLC